MTQGLIKLCSCTGRDGFTNDNGTYVCARCHLPMPQAEEKESGGLAYFRGGPLDGKAYAYRDLLYGDPRVDVPVDQYRWTHEIVQSKMNNKTARVWVWDGDTGRSGAVDTGEVRQDMSQNTTADGVTNVQLLERRKALGLSRPKVAERAGVTVSQLANMEVSGKRTKEGIMDAVHKALQAFERESGDKAAAGDKEDHAAATG